MNLGLVRELCRTGCDKSPEEIKGHIEDSILEAQRHIQKFGNGNLKVTVSMDNFNPFNLRAHKWKEFLGVKADLYRLTSEPNVYNYEMKAEIYFDNGH